MMPGPFQIALNVLVLLLLVGAGKIPRLMGGMALGITAFKRGLKDNEDGDKAELASIENLSQQLKKTNF